MFPLEPSPSEYSFLYRPRRGSKRRKYFPKRSLPPLHCRASPSLCHVPINKRSPPFVHYPFPQTHVSKTPSPSPDILSSSRIDPNFIRSFLPPPPPPPLNDPFASFVIKGENVSAPDIHSATSNRIFIPSTRLEYIRTRCAQGTRLPPRFPFDFPFFSFPSLLFSFSKLLSLSQIRKIINSYQRIPGYLVRCGTRDLFFFSSLFFFFSHAQSVQRLSEMRRVSVGVYYMRVKKKVKIVHRGQNFG